MARFEGKVALVTGAASGIGRATAIRLAEEGAAVACVDRAVDGAKETAAAITEKGGRAIAVECDVLDLDQIRATVARTVDELGRLDVLCNIAGIGHFAKDEEETPEAWHRILGVNLTGTYFMSQAALPHLLANKGAIVNCASTAGSTAASMPPTRSVSASASRPAAVNCAMTSSTGRKSMSASKSPSAHTTSGFASPSW